MKRGEKRRLLPLAAVLCAVTIFLGSCSYIDSAAKKLGLAPNESNTESAGGANEAGETDEEYPPLYDDESMYELYPLRGLLSDTEKKYYDRFVRELSDFASEVKFSNADEDGVVKAYKSAVNDHPELFWLSENYSYTKSSGLGNVSIEFRPKIFLSFDEIKEMKAKLEAALDELLQKSEPPAGGTGDTGDTDKFERALAIHDGIADIASYDDAVYDDIKEGKDAERFYPQACAYGCLVDGLCVCTGYSAAYQLALQREGIPAGRLKSDEHEWNYLMLGGEYYYADLTWDDDDDGAAEHYYFLITSEDMLSEDDHIPSAGELFIPEADATEYNYYIKMGYYVESFDIEEITKMLERQYASGTMELRFATHDVYEAAKRRLIDGEEIFGIVFSDGERFPQQCSYYEDEDNLLLTIYS